jgi:hypothetical protein
MGPNQAITWPKTVLVRLPIRQPRMNRCHDRLVYYPRSDLTSLCEVLANSADCECVVPASRQTVRDENTWANDRRLASAAYGPNTCQHGYVWSEADASDRVCVSSTRRTEVAQETLTGWATWWWRL